MSVVGPVTGYQATDPNTNNAKDLGSMFVSKDYMLDAYPNLVPGRTAPGLWACGYNNTGQLGLGTIINVSSPVQIGTLVNWKQISNSSSAYASGAIKNDGTLWTWGANNIYGNLGIGSLTPASYSSPVQIGSLTNWKQLSVSQTHMLAVKIDGTLWSWGGNSTGQLGNGTISSYSSPIQIGALTNWKQVSSGGIYNGSNLWQSFGIQSNGTLWAWGYNYWGYMGNNTNYTNGNGYSSPIQVGALTNWKQVAAGVNHVAAIKTDGTLWTWGANPAGALGNGTGAYYSSPIQVGALTTWQYVACGYQTTCGIQSNGTLWAWGLNSTGELGLGNTSNYSSPIQVGALTNWKLVSTSGSINNITSATGGSTAAIRTDGTMWSWGLNSVGQLGQGNTTNISSPVQVGTLTTWKSISMGFETLAISDGYI